MSEDMQKLTLRVTQLEIAVYRLITMVKDQSDAMKAAATLPITCEVCTDDITTKTCCASPTCEWG